MKMQSGSLELTGARPIQLVILLCSMFGEVEDEREFIYSPTIKTAEKALANSPVHVMDLVLKYHRIALGLPEVTNPDCKKVVIQRLLEDVVEARNFIKRVAHTPRNILITH
jgi:hypothetical protein